jgi:hypothetical protein
MPLPDLPLEVILIVAQFLAGDHAFATLGALHSCSHALKEETSSVLYETIFLDNPKKVPKWFCSGVDVVKRIRQYIK